MIGIRIREMFVADFRDWPAVWGYLAECGGVWWRLEGLQRLGLGCVENLVCVVCQWYSHSSNSSLSSGQVRYLAGWFPVINA